MLHFNDLNILNDDGIFFDNIDEDKNKNIYYNLPCDFIITEQEDLLIEIEDSKFEKEKNE